MPVSPRPKRYEVDHAKFLALDNVHAHLCAMASYHAYYNNSDVFYRNELGASTIKRLEFNENLGIPRVYALKLHECNVIAIPGTTNYSQLYHLLTRVNYCTLPGCGVFAYCGWYWGACAIAIWNQWSDTIKEVCADAPTFFTGHSLGGSIAAALHAMVNAAPPVDSTLRCTYTFGAPRLGNQTLANQVPVCFNLCNAEDLVPKLPPVSAIAPPNPLTSPVMLGVSSVMPHVPHGTVVMLQPGGSMTRIGTYANLKPANSNVEWDLLCAAAKPNWTLNPFKKITKPVEQFQNSIQHHLMDSYLKRLELSIPASGGEKPEAYDGGREIEDLLPPEPFRGYEVVVPQNRNVPTGSDSGVRPKVQKSKH